MDTEKAKEIFSVAMTMGSQNRSRGIAEGQEDWDEANRMYAIAAENKEKLLKLLGLDASDWGK